MTIQGWDAYIPETTESMRKDIEKLTRGKGTDLGDLATEVIKQIGLIVSGVQKVTEDFLKMLDMLVETGYVKSHCIPSWLMDSLNTYRSKQGKTKL